MKKFTILSFILLLCNLAGKAQIEGAYISSKGYNAIGYGGFLNFTFPITEANSLTVEAGLLSFSKDDDNMVIAPLIAGYRISLDGTGSGFYVEPTGGYTIGGSDIQKNYIDPATGTYAEQKVTGITGGIGAGYILPGNSPLNFGLWYKRVFVSGDPSLNVFALRISHPLSFRRRE